MIHYGAYSIHYENLNLYSRKEGRYVCNGRFFSFLNGYFPYGSSEDPRTEVDGLDVGICSDAVQHLRIRNRSVG